MRQWKGLSRLMRALGKRLRGPSADQRLAIAYRNIFMARTEDAELVLTDLADFTGFYVVNEADTPPDARAYADGKRAAFGRLFRFLNLTAEERSALAEAARAETIVSAQKGNPG